MENLDINEYLNKVDGDTLDASEWNTCLTAVQAKVNELVENADAAYIKPDTGIPGNDIAENAITTDKISDGSITALKISGINYRSIKHMDVYPHIESGNWSSSDASSIFGMRSRDVFMFLAEGYKFVFVINDADENSIHYDLYQGEEVSDGDVTITFSGIINHPTYGLGIFTASFSQKNDGSFVSSGSFKAFLS